MNVKIISDCTKVIDMLLSDRHLDKRIKPLKELSSNSGGQNMSKIKRHVNINGVNKWILAENEQEYADKVIKLTEDSKPGGFIFEEYANTWFELFSKPNVETVTAITYRRQLDLYLIPFFKERIVESINVNDAQQLFNSIHKSKSTKQKVKTVLNMIFESAIEDGIITKNPLRSKKFRLEGSESVFTKEYSVEQMRFLVSHINCISKEEDRLYLALQSLHPLRLEEVLGLKWEDVDIENRTINVVRAITHPNRNQPEIKEVKTEASKRRLPLSEIAAEYLTPKNKSEFILGGKNPYSYQKVRKMCERIQKETGFDDKITPIRFRTTVLTDIYDKTKDIKLAQYAAGHTTPTMTLKHYVKGRDGMAKGASVIDSIYC